MIGVSLHPGVLLPMLADTSSEQIACAFGGSEQVLPTLYRSGVRSIELRAHRNLPPEEMLSFFERVHAAGMNVTAHAAMTSAETAVQEVLAPFSQVIQSGIQPTVTVTLHPLSDAEETARALTALADSAPAFTFALENNRRMPDGSVGDPCPLVLDIVTRVNRRNVGICWDFGHHWYNVLTLKQGNRAALPPAGFIRQVVHTHIHGTNGLTTHFPASNSSLPLREWCAALSFPGVYNLELEPSRYDDSIDVKESYLSSIRHLAAAIPPTSAALSDVRKNVRRWWEAAFAPDATSSFALTGPSGYVFSTGGVLWGMDLCLRHDWAAEALGGFAGQCLHRLRYMIYTHEHDDHLDPHVLKLLPGSPVTVIAPDFLPLPGIDEKQVLRVQAGQAYALDGLTLTPFESRHYRPGTDNGVPEYGYLIETDGQTLLFPGDVRDYNPDCFPRVSCDWLFAHLWLGDGAAENLSACHPYAEALADFVVTFDPKHVVLAHLYESARPADALWTQAHAGLTAGALYRRCPDAEVFAARPGRRYSLR